MDSSRLPAPPPGADDRWFVSDRLGHQLIRVMRAMERAKAAKSVGVDGVERAAYVLLARLVLEGPRRSNALAESVHSDPSTVSRQVAGLVRAGLVERRPDPEDGRATLLAPTAEGLRVFQANRDRRNRQISAMTEHWDEADRTRLVELLERLAGDIEHQHATTTPAPPSAAVSGQEAS
ncbi:MarR family transcriptional regulator [Actinomycetospora sp. NBRC 106375]|uniref:MarR family winged helix-turn-helix transcriptional regulator n=1 Tax=Actinomycetospora sp. NBRC 106375 TaxID=3032207 RepID=UPI0024A40224|nr:MarR family winged helix-turn-helix transcriptional regulator [Actinomycetospora sp. NBRC 106375]GLZ48643.1 MarR family transcriptional regulator [Actinomycetospora sp. NBRC 106375]